MTADGATRRLSPAGDSRERPVSCRHCRRETIAIDAVCDRCVCPACQGAGWVLGSSGRSGLDGQAYPCRACWGNGHGAFEPSSADAMFAERMRAEGRVPRFAGSPRAFTGWVRQETS